MWDLQHTSPHVETAQLMSETKLLKGGPIAGGSIGPTTVLEYALILYQEVEFKPNSTLQNRLVR